jgi:hypothetical protein
MLPKRTKPPARSAFRRIAAARCVGTGRQESAPKGGASHGRERNVRFTSIRDVASMPRAGIVTFAQYRHFFGQFQSGYLTHRLLILLV